jgi:hypothetical protein
MWAQIYSNARIQEISYQVWTVMNELLHQKSYLGYPILILCTN